MGRNLKGTERLSLNHQGPLTDLCIGHLALQPILTMITGRHRPSRNAPSGRNLKGMVRLKPKHLLQSERCPCQRGFLGAPGVSSPVRILRMPLLPSRTVPSGHSLKAGGAATCALLVGLHGLELGGVGLPDVRVRNGDRRGDVPLRLLDHAGCC